MAKSIHQLLPEVAEKFRCTTTPCCVIIQRLGRTIDLRTLTLAEAEELVKDPLFTYLIPRRTRKKAVDSSTVN
jgi:hypothetical protein